MKNRQLLGIVGVIMLIIGAFSPIVHIPIVGSITYVKDGKGDGIFIIAFAVLAVYYIYKEQYNQVRLAGMASLGMLLFTFVNFQIKISEMEKKLDKDLASNPFKNIVDLATNNIYFEYGFAITLGGAILLLLVGFMKNHTQGEQNKSTMFADKDSNHPKSENTYTQLPKEPISIRQTLIEQADIRLAIKKNDKKTDDILTSMQTSAQHVHKQPNQAQSPQENEPKKLNRPRYEYLRGKESFLEEHGLKVAVVTIILFSGLSLYLSKKPKDIEPSAGAIANIQAQAQEDAPEKIQIEPVNVNVGKRTQPHSNIFSHPISSIQGNASERSCDIWIEMTNERFQKAAIYAESGNKDMERAYLGVVISSAKNALIDCEPLGRAGNIPDVIKIAEDRIKQLN